MQRKIEIVTNLAVIFAAIVFSATIVHEYWFQKPGLALGAVARTENSLKGTQLQLEGVRWNGVNKTLVMALSTACHYCQDSIPFYQQVSQSSAVKTGHVAIVTVFPQTKEEAESFVKINDIRAGNILSTPLESVRATATPTLYLVDSTGKIENVWIGELSRTQQQELLEKLAKLS